MTFEFAFYPYFEQTSPVAAGSKHFAQMCVKFPERAYIEQISAAGKFQQGNVSRGKGPQDSFHIFHALLMHLQLY